MRTPPYLYLFLSHGDVVPQSLNDDDGALGVDDEFDIYEELQLDLMEDNLELSNAAAAAAAAAEAAGGGAEGAATTPGDAKTAPPPADAETGTSLPQH